MTVNIDPFDDLQYQTELFRTWASAYPIEQRYGEWECDYPEWTLLSMTFLRFTQACPAETWSQEAIETVLYVLARDNEMQYLVSELAKTPALFMFVANASLLSSERDARWQIAWELGDLPVPLSEVEPILLRFAEDEEEYVRRQALMSLGRAGSPAVERLAEQAWIREDEQQQYQRMAVLEALRQVKSPLLFTYLDKADDVDSMPYLTAYAASIRNAIS